MIRSTVFQLTLVAAIMTSEPVAAVEPPRMLIQDTATVENGRERRSVRICAILRKSDGSFSFYDRLHPNVGPLKLPDRGGNMHALLPYLPPEIAESNTIMDSGILSNTQVLQTGKSEITSAFVRGELLDRETARRVGLPRYLNVWMQQASSSGVTEPRMIWRGYNGSQIEYEQMSNGRIIVPFGSFQPHATPSPPQGRHKTVIQYSDDGGTTWRASASQLISPCYPDFNGLNEGACEPAIERLLDGRIWMLMRTQAGFLYESWSHDNGTRWERATASRFNTSTGPPCIMRHKDGRLVVCWNNCEMPPRANGDGVYGGRDALHIAISEDDGEHWRGFREIYLDHRRNDNPAESGDRGTAYPLAAFTGDGYIAVVAGEGKGGRNVVLVDPDWITETTAECDFSDGLRNWSVYTHHGPAKRWWRARAVGCELVTNPTDQTTTSLLVRKQPDLPAEGATWNFPNGWAGSMKVRVMLRKGSLGGNISLSDRMFDPSNDFGEQFAVFRLSFGADGSVGTATLVPEHWHDVTFRWDLDRQECQLLVDDRLATSIPLLNHTLNGVSYVRFRADSSQIKQPGFLVDRVFVSVEDPYAPVSTVKSRKEHEQRYVDNIVPTWQS